MHTGNPRPLAAPRRTIQLHRGRDHRPVQLPTCVSEVMAERAPPSGRGARAGRPSPQRSSRSRRRRAGCRTPRPGGRGARRGRADPRRRDPRCAMAAWPCPRHQPFTRTRPRRGRGSGSAPRAGSRWGARSATRRGRCRRGRGDRRGGAGRCPRRRSRPTGHRTPPRPPPGSAQRSSGRSVRTWWLLLSVVIPIAWRVARAAMGCAALTRRIRCRPMPSSTGIATTSC